MPTLLSLVDLEVDVKTSFSANSDNEVGIITTLGFSVVLHGNFILKGFVTIAIFWYSCRNAHIDGLVQDTNRASANTLEIPQYCLHKAIDSHCELV